MRSIVILSAVWVLSAGLGSASAASDAAPRITYEARQLRLKSVVSMLERFGRTNVSLDPALANVPVTVSIRNQSLDDAFQSLVDAARQQVPDISLEKRDGIYRIQLKPGGKVPPLPEFTPQPDPARKITLVTGNLPLREALELVYRQPGVPAAKPPVQVEAAVPDVPVNLIFSDDAEPVLMRYLVRQAAPVAGKLRLEEKEGQYTVGLRPDAGREAPTVPRGKLPPADPNSQRILIGFRNAPLRYVVRAVLGSVLPSFGKPQEYVIDASVPDAPVSFSLVTRNPDEALQTTLAELKKQVRGLEIRMEGGKLHLTGPAL